MKTNGAASSPPLAEGADCEYVVVGGGTAGCVAAWRLLTETDGPFTTSSLKPARSPGDVISAVRFIARVKKMRAEDVQAQIWRNLQIIEAPL